jgi:hypothetical protein
MQLSWNHRASIFAMGTLLVPYGPTLLDAMSPGKYVDAANHDGAGHSVQNL